MVLASKFAHFDDDSGERLAAVSDSDYEIAARLNAIT
jgi:uncharacterized iron-regulated membrane protein